MKNYKLIIMNIVFLQPRLKNVMVMLFILLLTNSLFAQVKPRVTSNIDSTQIKIGEQINYKILVETDSTSIVIFPEGQTFAPLEMVETLKVDTIINQDKYNLIKKYALTQFDSGHYTIPRQQILINDKPYFTDSLKVEVNTIEVDSIKQKMFDIKPIVEVEKKSDNSWVKILLIVLIGLIIIGALVYWFVFRKKPLTEDEKVALLPPYDRAMIELQKLDESKYLIQSEYKGYYSELTNIVRSYIEEDVHISALESTTDELINKLEMLKDSGSLDIDHETIKQFQRVLKTADLVKFAKLQPESNAIDGDRKTIEQIVVKTKEAIPEPTEEELLENQEYLEDLERKKGRKKIVISIAIGVFLLLTTLGGFIYYYGFDHVKDTTFGHPTKELLEGEWVYSEYGFPAISIETPRVLKRTEVPLPDEAKAILNSNQSFVYGGMTDNFYIMVNSATYKKDVEVDLKKAIEGSITSMEANGAKNLIVKEEEFLTQTGKKGLKAFGSMDVENPTTKKTSKGEYLLLNFTENGGFEQVIIIYQSGDTYAEDIVKRILNSIDFKTQKS